MKKQTCVIAHGTGTFQNRSTESDVLSKCATSLNMKNLKVTGLKGYLGHTMGPAGGDQLACVWEFLSWNYSWSKFNSKIR